MALYIENLVNQVRELAQTAAERAAAGHMEEARGLLHALTREELNAKLAEVVDVRGKRTPWLVARPAEEPPGATYPPPDAPTSYTVLAADGSHIAPDRHSPVHYIVLNTGLARLSYGRAPAAHLTNRSHFWFRDDELHLTLGNGARYPIEGTLLGIQMALAELEYLAEGARQADPPAVALRDGALIFWPLQNEDKALQEELMRRVRRALRAFHDAGIPVASYISYPGYRELVNSLRVFLCGHCTRASECGSCTVCAPEDAVLCKWLEPVRDQWLVGGLLEPGQRSAIFESTSALQDRYRDPDGVDHRVQFFYVHTGSEIARVEAPAWVMQDPAYRDLVHAVVVDQCRRGEGYPPALQEAHEQAVISTGDRQLVQQMLERELARLGIPYIRSAKDWSKRVRRV